ncbi:MAG: trimethylamine methyltransferase family protein [Thiolinea sp.]
MFTENDKSSAKTKGSVRRGRRARTDARKTQTNPAQHPEMKGLQGGCFAPLSTDDMQNMDQAIRDILQTIGLSEAPSVVIEHITARGGSVTADGRLTFPATLIDEALKGMQRHFTLHGQLPGHELLMSGKQVHMGSGGAAPSLLDMDTGAYRDSTLQDLYNAARIVDTLDNVHFFSRSLVARDMPNDWLLDINTAYACLSGTRKHVFTSISRAEHVKPIAEMCYALAGSREAFIAKPFLSLNINHVVPPLRFAADACEVMAEAARYGLPMHANSFGQLGASTPVTIAGSVIQTAAESLAGMIFAWTVNPEAKVTFGPRPMITDLRTGAMSGGSGEQAVLMAAAMQMAQYYDLPNNCIAGATDSKVPDAQSGYEKSLAVTLAAQAGCNAITQACGMHASLVGCAFDSYIIDNDMLGGILRSLTPIEVNTNTLSTDVIRSVVNGEGHYLGHSDTLQRMQSDFLYPQIADRQSPAEWQETGALDMRARAKNKARDILENYFPTHISAVTDKQLRTGYDIQLPQEVMRKR